LGGSAEGIELPLAAVDAVGLQAHDVVAGAHDDLGLAVAQHVAVGHGRALVRVARVDDGGLFGVGRDAEADGARGQGLQIALDLLAIVGLDVVRAAEVARIGIERLAVALEAHGAEGDVAQDLGRLRDFVGPLELDVRLFDALAVGVLKVVDARAKVLARFVGDVLGAGGRRRADEGDEPERPERGAAEAPAPRTSAEKAVHQGAHTTRPGEADGEIFAPVRAPERPGVSL
jgi:hypothetical protein